MYVRITSKCNMTCQHCVWSCSYKGEHMDMWTFQKAMDLCHDLEGNERIELGGGEPTMHPQFFDMLRYAMGSFNEVWLATNGTKKKTMLRLASIMTGEYDYESEDDPFAIYQSHEDQLGVALSTDYYHDRMKVSEEVWSMWNRWEGSSGFEIRNSANITVYEQGRAKRQQISTEKGCVLPSLYVNPDGTIVSSSHEEAPRFGTVFSPDVPDGWNCSTCHKMQEYLENKEDQIKYPRWEEEKQYATY